MMKRKTLVSALLSGSILFPAGAVAQDTKEVDAADRSNCQILIAYLEENRGFDFPVDLEQARNYQQARDDEACRTGIEQINVWVENWRDEEGQQQQAGADADETDEGAEIVVRQQPPTINVEQAAPRVTVQQAQPQVTVHQPQPEILVRQPAATVTVDIPQPEIVVRMPEPDVEVQLPRPQVEVEQPEPEIRVTQQGEPEVLVESDEAEVLMNQRQQAAVSIQRADRPQIRYEREEPQIRVNQPEGEPNVRYEQASRTAGEEQDIAAEPAATGSTAAGTTELEQEDILVSNLLQLSLFDQEGEEIGQVERVMIDPESGESYLVLSMAAREGTGEKQVALRLSQLRMENDRLLLQGLTTSELRDMPEWSEGDGFTELDAGESARVQTVE